LSHTKTTAEVMRALAIFEVVARTGSFRAAGTEMGVDHLTAARQVRALENRLGVRLVAVHKQKLKVTSRGQSLLDAIAPSLNALALAVEAHTRGAGRSTLRLACEPGFLGCWLMPRIRDLRNEHPNLSLIFLPVSTALKQVDIDADVTIRFVEKADSDDIVLVTPDAFPVCCPDLLKAKNGFQTLDQLLSSTLIHDDTDDYWQWWLSRHGIDPRRTRRAQSLQLMDSRLALQAARDGLGIAIANSVIVADELATGQLVPARPERLQKETYVARITNPAKRADARKFIAWTRKQLKAHAKLSAGDTSLTKTLGT
jgi:LysR family transcriptional regulator, glycine cleavage system transcriptional activator